MKDGKNRSDDQRYRCRACNRNFTLQLKPHACSRHIRQRAVAMHLNGHNYRQIARNFNINHQTWSIGAGKLPRRRAGLPSPSLLSRSTPSQKWISCSLLCQKTSASTSSLGVRGAVPLLECQTRCFMSRCVVRECTADAMHLVWLPEAGGMTRHNHTHRPAQLRRRRRR